MKTVRLVLFDCDGTLVDSQHSICTAMNRAFELQGLRPPRPADTLGVVGLSLDVAIRRLAPELDDTTLATVEQDYKAMFFTLRQQGGGEGREPLYPGMAALVLRLAEAGCVLGIATGKSRRGLQHVLDLNDLAGFMTTLQTPDNAPGKPHPGMVLQAMDEVGATPESMVVVGDTTYDIEMALAARAHAIGVSWGYHPVEALESIGPRAVVDDAEALQRAIDAAWG